MADIREQAIEAGARAYDSLIPYRPVTAHDIAAAVVDAAEPIIRADEREAVLARQRRSMWAEELAAKIEAEVRERLRAQVGALPSAMIVAGVWNGEPPYDDDWDRPVVFLADVLALLEAAAIARANERTRGYRDGWREGRSEFTAVVRAAVAEEIAAALEKEALIWQVYHDNNPTDLERRYAWGRIEQAKGDISIALQVGDRA